VLAHLDLVCSPPVGLESSIYDLKHMSGFILRQAYSTTLKCMTS
jgi:hypothetical protein